MNVYIRQRDDTQSHLLTTIEFGDFDELVAFVRSMGGVHFNSSGGALQLADQRIVVGSAGGYVELIFGSGR